MEYPVVEHFYSPQGEGLFAGAPAFFVRLFGCPVKCKWCDTQESWRATPSAKMSAEEIAKLAAQTKCGFAVITGGEPTIHPLQELVDAFHARNIRVHLETSGVMEKTADFDWITLSPKLFANTHSSYLESADEFKFIVSNREEITEYVSRFEKYIDEKKAVFITPEWSRVSDRELLDAISETVKTLGAPYRLGCQLHKYYFVK
jgi:Organic radical activating enzymes